MLEFPTWKRVYLWAITLFFALAAVPSLVSLTNARWPEFLPSPMINLGLDLAGGSHILLEGDPRQVAKQRLETMEESVRTALRDANPRIRIGDISTANGRLSFMLEDPSQVDAARGVIEPLTTGAGLTGQRDWQIQVVDGSRFVLTQTTAGLNLAVKNAMESATEVVRKRIDALGTREPTIIRQGDNRIVVQVPGLQDPQQLKELLGQTAELEFKLVDQTALQSDIQQGIAPPGSQIVPYAEGTIGQGTSIAVKRLGGIRGNSLTNAQQSFNPQTNEPVVSIQFDSAGGRRFGILTRENVGKPFAIILDGEVLSAPNINEPIDGGQAQISGGFTVETANQLAIALRSGALPIDLTVIEERTVGPDLGADSIQKGAIGLLVGLGLLMVFMIVTYGRFGVYTCIALIINLLMILGTMALLGPLAALTLPGIAGLVLTVGAAVDANVLINERIREERARGRRVVQAVEMGYKEASRAIMDANVTNVIAAVIMFMFGTGPVRGFAVVLMIGIVTSVFTAVTLTRMWVAGWLRKKRPTDIVL
ncbi:protein translocase subunit SecD [Croceibacterium sp. LX-88]|jgi:preprotein translocase subunit SecD|uniref:Protein translocase subunit SecD n=1 Tax=Croceibacterium selenioxidans TaxID=2838833 RepID=A0ABS5W489_9SPHN|nr:protein translocase subunit SecD [Croceibacterium selenioxidans]MBT2134137.1 protein translocase subunit SecD [Croceibacterium selenioxidans]